MFKEIKEAPEVLICPITKALMKEPVVAEDEQIYEKSAIQQWFKEHGSVSPKTGKILKSQTLTLSLMLQKMIEDFILTRKNLEEIESALETKAEPVRKLSLADQFKKSFVSVQEISDKHKLVLILGPKGHSKNRLAHYLAEDKIDEKLTSLKAVNSESFETVFSTKDKTVYGVCSDYFMVNNEARQAVDWLSISAASQSTKGFSKIVVFFDNGAEDIVRMFESVEKFLKINKSSLKDILFVTNLIHRTIVQQELQKWLLSRFEMSIDFSSEQKHKPNLLAFKEEDQPQLITVDFTQSKDQLILHLNKETSGMIRLNNYQQYASMQKLDSEYIQPTKTQKLRLFTELEELSSINKDDQSLIEQYQKEIKQYSTNLKLNQGKVDSLKIEVEHLSQKQAQTRAMSESLQAYIKEYEQNYTFFSPFWVVKNKDVSLSEEKNSDKPQFNLLKYKVLPYSGIPVRYDQKISYKITDGSNSSAFIKKDSITLYTLIQVIRDQAKQLKLNVEAEVFASIMKKSEEFKLADYQQLLILYITIKAALDVFDSDVAKLFRYNLNLVMRYYLLQTKDLLLKVPLESIFEIDLEAEFSAEQIDQRWQELIWILNAENINSNVASEVIPILEKSKAHLLAHPNCRKEAPAKEEKYVIPKTGILTTFSALPLGNDSLGFPELLDLTDKRDYRKFIDFLSKKLNGMDEKTLETEIVKQFQGQEQKLQLIKSSLMKDKTRSGFKKLETDCESIFNALSKFPSKHDDKQGSDHTSMNQMLVRQLHDTLNYLIQMALAKYPAWFRKHQNRLNAIIVKFKKNIDDAGFGSRFAQVSKTIAEGGPYLKSNKESLLKSGINNQYSDGDFDLCIGYLTLVGENLQHFPEKIQKHEVLIKLGSFITDLQKNFQIISEQNDFVLHSYIEFKDAFLTQRASVNYLDVVVQQIQQQQLKLIEKKLTSSEMDLERKNALLVTKKILLEKQSAYQLQQFSTISRYRLGNYEKSLKEKIFLAKGAELKIQFFELIRAFDEFKCHSQLKIALVHYPQCSELILTINIRFQNLKMSLIDNIHFYNPKINLDQLTESIKTMILAFNEIRTLCSRFSLKVTQEISEEKLKSTFISEISHKETFMNLPEGLKIMHDCIEEIEQTLAGRQYEQNK